MARNDYELVPEDIEGIDQLVELATDLRSSWQHGTDELWIRLDAELWALTRNPWVVLQTVSRTRLQAVMQEPGYRNMLSDLVTARRAALGAPSWFSRNYSGGPLSAVAYFSMEFGLSEALPIYSGGLGTLAGDQLKTADDLGVPVVAVGLLYQRGYFRQFIDREGKQAALYPYNDPFQLPVTPVRNPEGEWSRFHVRLPDHSLWLRTWQARIGRCTLYLLDSNDPANLPVDRGITSELYGGGPELRLLQELVLGIGGWRVLHGLGIRPEVCHLNEGHAAFAVLERARTFMEENGRPFEVALAVTRAGNLFTTHTPVPAGFDRFAPELIERYLARYAELLGISLHDLMALGRENPDNSREPFNVAYLAVRGSGAINGVSRLHGSVSRGIFQPLFPRWPRAEVPIGHVTNGVHTPTWDTSAADRLWTEACGADRWRGPTETVGEPIRSVPDATLWEMRGQNRAGLVDFVRSRLAVLRVGAGSPEATRTILDPNAFTLGFARRFATYKRPNLLLADTQRLIRILTNPARPVQLIVAGKAHPQDEPAKEMVEEWIRFVRRPELRSQVAFLTDYDLVLAEAMVGGVDLWLNTPRRPMEACGTSGMKVLVNGGLNLSELDGWWDEAYAPEVGWALGDGQFHDDDPAWDAAEADALYRILEEEAIPCFYQRNAEGIPTAWVAKMRESMARLAPRFSANRTLREYTESYYLVAAKAYRRRAEAGGRLGEKVLAWQREVARCWAGIHFGNVRVQTFADHHQFDLQVYLGELDPDSVEVQLYADRPGTDGCVRHTMRRAEPLVGAAKGWSYTAQVPAERPAEDFTPRVIPRNADVAIPLEAPQIKWQR